MTKRQISDANPKESKEFFKLRANEASMGEIIQLLAEGTTANMATIQVFPPPHPALPDTHYCNL